MGVHRFQAHTKLEGHLAAAGALADPLQDLPLPPGQGLQSVSRDRVGLGRGGVGSRQQQADLLQEIGTGAGFVHDGKQHRREVLRA